ncbi:hypothetical protein KO498_09605 [Lentibacter algarum]|uniref:glutathione S-transferase C-terminal domain-containing protein n=1 Tax=Lentibacter algarum TaxID=576131 RepID=UPI001C06E84B|nr:glutathione S-transferase C-terminal domain-containing protein [Lentibacter algarum]MBU2982066.1 hypothetical protein [Lentibacter algarum]
MMSTLTGYQDSVYSWCARAGLKAKGVVHAYEELDPFREKGLVLKMASLTVADLMLAPMLQYFTAASHGVGQMQTYPALARRLGWTDKHSAFSSTRPKMLERAGELQ